MQHVRHWLTRVLSIGYQRRALTLLLLILTLDYADRTLIGAMGPTLKAVFHLSNAELGLLAAAVNIVGALAAVPFGMLVDRVNRTRLLAISLAVWSGAIALVGAAVSFLMLIGFRLLLGVVTATSGPATPSLVGDLVPARRQGQALGYVDSGQLVGIGAGFVLAALVTGFLALDHGLGVFSGGHHRLAKRRAHRGPGAGGTGPGGGDPGGPAHGGGGRRAGALRYPLRLTGGRRHVGPAAHLSGHAAGPLPERPDSPLRRSHLPAGCCRGPGLARRGLLLSVAGLG